MWGIGLPIWATKRITYGYGKLQKRLQPRLDEIARLEKKAEEVKATDPALAEKILYKQKVSCWYSVRVVLIWCVFRIRCMLLSTSMHCAALAAALRTGL